MRRTLIGRWLACGACCALLSACEPLPVHPVTIKPRPRAQAAAADTGTAPAAPAGYGDLSGTVTFTGNIPGAKPLLVVKGDAAAKDPEVCAAADVPDESLQVDPDSKGIANVIVVLAKKPAHVKPGLEEVPGPIDFDQKGCKFLPHVLIVRVGQTVLIKSQDAIGHNTHTFPERNDQFNSAIGANDQQGVPFSYKKSENVPVEVKCDLHTWMKAYHVPVDHPYVARTDKDGKFRIEGLPAGKHTFKVWHERAKFLETKLLVEIEPDKETTKDLSYGAPKLAGRDVQTGRMVSYARLQQGGELTPESED